MSKRTVVRLSGVRFASKAELRSHTSVTVPGTMVADRVLVPGQKITLSVKAGSRRRMFTGTLTPNYFPCGKFCPDGCGVKFWSVNK